MSSATSSSNDGSVSDIEEATNQALETQSVCDKGVPLGESSKLDYTDAQTAEAPESNCIENGIDSLLQRHRNEIMYELRRISMGDRPVTGQDSRQTLENFFRQTQEESSNGSRSTAEERGIRPETVVVEVQGLVERRPVSSVLQSSLFRRQLENTIRGSLNRLPASSHPTSVGFSRTTAPTANNRNSPVVPASESPSTNSSIVNGENRQETVSLSGVPNQNHTQSWVQEYQNQPVVVQWDTIEDAQREAMVYEISELVHRQLVTTALQEGDTRHRLESHLQRRAEARGANGVRVQQVLQTLPRGRIQRNDFSHLGIVSGQDGAGSDNMDNVSVISATAAVHVPYAQSNAAMNHEIRSLKTQMQELKQMMKLSFDLQLDVQRAIRQEVAAAMNNVNQGASTSSGSTTRPLSDSQCLICLEKSADSVLYQCGHVCVCYGCGMELKSRNAHCPVCRAPIKDIIRAYKC